MKSKSIKTTCAYCGVGCGIIMEQKDNESWRARGDPDHPANRGRLCQKGSSLGETLEPTGRLHTPMLHGQPVTAAEATGHIADRLQTIITEYGPDSVGFYVSGQLLTEDYYVANKFCKGFLGTANIDTNSRLCMASTVAGHKRAFGEDLVPACYDDLDHCEVAIIIGSNMAQCHPVLFQRLIQRQEKPYLITIDPRASETAKQSDLHLPLAPGSDVALFNGLLKFISDHGGVDLAYAEQHLNGFGAAIAQVQSYSIPRVSAICQVDEAKLGQFYRKFLSSARCLSLFSQGVNQSTCGVDKVNAILNVHLITGKIGKPGAAPFSLTGQYNAMGGREVGGLANQLAAHHELYDASSRELIQQFWQSPHMPASDGLKAVDMFEAARNGALKVIWIMATNPLVSMPHKTMIQQALANCELVIVSDCFTAAETLKYADIILPAAAWGEKDGTTTNSERLISRQRAFLKPPAHCLQDWQWISLVARKMGFDHAFPYTDSATVFREYAQLTNLAPSPQRRLHLGPLADVSTADYDTLTPVPWPITAQQPEGTKRLFADGEFPTAGGRASVVTVSYQPPRVNLTVNQDTFVLNTGRTVNHWHTMTRTHRAATLTASGEMPRCYMHPDDITRLAAKGGGNPEPFLVELANSQGQVYLRLATDPGQTPGQVFVPFHWSEPFAASSSINTLVAPHVDPLSGQPEFKCSTVTIKPVATKTHGIILSTSPLEPPKTFWWLKLPLADYAAYLFADLALPMENRNLADYWSPLLSDLNQEQCSQFYDESNGECSLIGIDHERLTHYGFICLNPQNLPDLATLIELMRQPNNLDRRAKYYLHTGSANPSEP
jgi:assimilatory nitrate reductase catalytic subunit